MKQLATKDELLTFIDEDLHGNVEAAINRYPDAEAVVIFENQAFDSMRFGDRTALIVGPSNTFTSVADCEGKWLHDLPSQRQYPISYWLIPEERS